MRTGKTGLDYFPLDVDFFDDPKVEFVTAKYGIIGENVSIKLLCRIYRNGYFLPWGEDETLIFAKRAGNEITYDIVAGVIQELVKREFFSKDHFSTYSILTSNGIQKRFLEATKRRKQVAIYREYLIADTEGFNVDILPLNDVSGTQRRKKGERKENIYGQNSFQELFWDHYPKHVKKKNAFLEWQKIQDLPEHANSFPSILEKHMRAKAEKKARGQFAAEFPDPERWLKYRRWEDEVEEKTEIRGTEAITCPSCKAQYKSNEAVNGKCPVCDGRDPVLVVMERPEDVVDFN